MFTKYIPIILSAISLVAAHGFVNEIAINGKTFKANQIGSKDKDSVIRSVTSQDPMKGADNKGLSCGPGSSPAKSMASINPGDDISFSWTGADGSPWPHEIGPMITYMGFCGKDGSKDCSQVDSSSVKWFKIDEAGAKKDGHWYLEELMSGKKAKVTIPNDIAPGNYLIRHEIVALHLATEYYGAEFYAGCAQLKVGGSGKDVPTNSELLSFPGSYSDNDPGIFTPNIFDGDGSNYKFPGGPVAKLVSGGGNSGSGDNSDDGDDSSPTPSSSSSGSEPTKASSGGGSGTCRLKNKRSSSAMKRSSYFPKRHSRIMRDLASPHHS